MEFCIATVAFWQSHGFDVTHWRKSVDGTLALVHKEYAAVLVPDIAENEAVTVYRSPSAELDGVLGGVEWSNNEADERWN